MKQSSRLGSLSSGLDMKAGMLIKAVFAETHVSCQLRADCADNQAEFNRGVATIRVPNKTQDAQLNLNFR